MVIGRDNIPARLKEAGLPQTDAIFNRQDHWATMAEVDQTAG